jgi:membrane-bound lytic murein transglycosylase F
MYKYLISCIIAVSVFFITGCYDEGRGKKEVSCPSKDLPQLVGDGEITVVTLNSSTSYFQYKMKYMGYEYDLISDFADAHGLKLNILIADNSERLIEMLQVGDADVVAYPVVVSNRLRQEVAFCGHERVFTQVLVQQSGRNSSILTDVTQLIGKEVYVLPSSHYAGRLENLNEELGGGILVRYAEEDSLTTEDLIEMVSSGDIPYTVSDDYIARLNKSYYRNIDVGLPIGFEQRSSWVVRKSSPALAAAIDGWASDKNRQQAYKAVAKYYFESSKRPFESTIPEIKNGQISPYDDLFRKYAASLNWDWLLLASIAYQESHFLLDGVSWAGARGLMGIMPATAEAFGFSSAELDNPEVSIYVGVECLRSFHRSLASIQDPAERIKLTLASYNAGLGHINDAQRLAGKYGKSPQVWEDNVAYYIRMKSEPKYYNDPVCKFGYLRSIETLNYVHDVLLRYEHYKKVLAP